MNIGFVAPHDPLDRKSWSGIYYRLFKSIEGRGFNVLPMNVNYSNSERRLIKAIALAHKLLTGKRYNPVHNHIKAYFASKHFSKAIKRQKIDVIFAPVAAAEVALIKTDIPIIYLSDSSFNQVMEYYDYEYWRNLSALSIKESNIIERKALQKSRYIIYPSKWAADYAVNFYKLDPQKIALIKFGANMDVPSTIQFTRNYEEVIKFLFLGVDWVRKGGDIALKTVEALAKNGYKVKIIVCGCVPPIKSDLMDVIPFLDKNKTEDKEQLEVLMQQCHFLFLPTRAECYGIVFCEASAFGLPIVTTDTGGVTSIVEHGVNGFALPWNAGVNEYLQLIQDLLNAPEKIEAITKSARVKYETELSWEIFGEKFEQLVKSATS